MGYLIFFAVLFLTFPVAADPVTVAVAAVVGGVNAAIAGTAILTGVLVSAALSVVGQVLAGKPEVPELSSFASIRTRGATQQFRQAVSERKIIYGETRTSGAILYAGVTENNKYLHLVVEVASHEIEEIGEIFINDLSIPADDLNGSGVVQSGRYANLVRIKKNLGTASQTADSDLVNDVPEWTTNHRLRGIAYIYVRMEWDRDVFTSGIPNISAWVKGKKCFDPRTSTTYWTPNIALQSNEFLTNTYYGLSATTVNQTELQGAANTCEEFVTTTNLDIGYTEVDTGSNIITLAGDRLQYQTGDRVQVQSGTIGGLSPATNYYVIVVQRKTTPRIKLASSLSNAISGTEINLTSSSSGNLRKNAEPRYFGGGVLKMSAARGENLKDILSGMSGNAVYAGGNWRLLAGEYQTPTISFNESDFAGGIEVTTKVSEKDRFNRAQGIYVSPLNDGNPSDYPLVKNDTYATVDGKEIKKNLDFPFTQRPHTAQRIAKLQLERMRQEIVFTAKFKLTAFKVQVGDNFYLTFDRYGWSNKVFEVVGWSLGTDGNAPVIEITARENASAVYDWNNGEETQVDPAPNTSLSNPFEVDPPTGLAVNPIEIRTASGDFTYEFELSWTPPVDQFVTSGGYYEIQFKRSVDATWKTSFRAEDEDTEITVKQVQPATNYDVRIRAVNYLRARSQYQQLLGFTTDSPSGATINLDYGAITGIVTEIDDFNGITDLTPDVLDFGDIV